jgi:CheY-like chemotaxis protein
MARLLVIDDEPSLRWVLRHNLEQLGYEVILAEDGLRGVAMAQKQHPDAIVLDLMMPIMDGYGVLAELGKDARTADVPVLVLSAMSLSGVQERCEQAGAAHFMTKPFELDDLADAIDGLLRSAA